MKAIRASHNAIQQQIADIQDTLQNMLEVLRRNSLPPPLTEIPLQETPIREIQTTDQPQSILLFDLSGNTAIDTLASQLNHQLPKYQDHLTLLITSRDRRNRFLSPPLHAAPRNLRTIPTHHDTNATTEDPLVDLLELSSYDSHIFDPGAMMLSSTAKCPKSKCTTYPTL